jgi:DNA-binding response OmpR family regulator
VVETLKNDERSSHIPIILLTAKADVQSRLAGLRRGADAYLSKPFHQEELLVTVAKPARIAPKIAGEIPANALTTIRMPRMPLPTRKTVSCKKCAL